MFGTADLQKRLRHVIAPTIGACVFGYFVYHAVQGERGVLSWLQMSQQLAESRTTLTALTEERRTIEHRVDLMGASGLDADLLEEQARIMLNVVDPADRLVIVKAPPATE